MNKRKIAELLTDKFETVAFKEYLLDMSEKIPDYFFTMPSSTSGKYHNATQCQTYGQLYHVFMFQSVLEHLLRLEGNKERFPITQERDCMRCVPLLHDAVKCGWDGSQYTVPDHPVLAAKFVMDTVVEHDIDRQWKLIIADMCEAHSGEWNTDRSGKVIMSKPRNTREFLIHECDILSSRNDLDWKISDELKALLPSPKPTVENYVIPIGKYKGRDLLEIFALDRDYCNWMADNIEKEPLRTLVRKLVYGEE